MEKPEDPKSRDADRQVTRRLVAYGSEGNTGALGKEMPIKQNLV